MQIIRYLLTIYSYNKYLDVINMINNIVDFDAKHRDNQFRLKEQ